MKRSKPKPKPPKPPPSPAEGRARRRAWVKYWGPSLLVLIAGFALAFHFMKPAPPSTFTMATGAPGGAYPSFPRFAWECISPARDSARILREGEICIPTQ